MKFLKESEESFEEVTQDIEERDDDSDYEEIEQGIKSEREKEE